VARRAWKAKPDRKAQRACPALPAGPASKATKARSESEEQARLIEGLAFAQIRQASDEGKLFGSVGKGDIAAFLAQHGVEVERRRIMLDEPIKTLGEVSVPIRLPADVTAQLKVSVSRE
jgi:large subunit ribosomal protein L9